MVLTIQPLTSAEQPTKSTIYSIQETHQLPNYSSTAADNVVATIFLFDNRTDYADQQILSETIEVDGAPVSPSITRTEENRVASFSLGTISGGSSKTITITNIIKITQVGPIDSSAVQGIVPSEMLAYTQPIANLWESDYPTINTKALELISGKPNIYDQAKAIFDFVKNYLTYHEQTTEHSAIWAYNNKIGDCSEFTHLFSALCRAAGIPTMFVSGYGYNPQKGSNLAAHGHAWAFIYLPGVGWTPMDLIWQQPKGEFAMLSNDHIIRSTSYGPDLVSSGEIRIPSNMVTYSVPHGQNNPNINFVSTEQIVREVAVEPQLSTAASMEGDIWKFYVKVTNAGAQAVENLNVTLSADSASLEVPIAQNISSLAAGGSKVFTFDVRVKGSVENGVVTARVTYDSSYGTLLAEGQSTVNVTVGGPSGGEINIMLFALIGVVIVLVVGAAIALLRR
jgi:hypothetical protein